MYRLIPGILNHLGVGTSLAARVGMAGRRSIFLRQLSPISETTREWMRRGLDYDSRECTRRRRQAERLAAKRIGAGE